MEEAHEKPEKVAEMEVDVNRTVSHSSGNKDLLKSFTGWVLSSWSGKDVSSDSSSSAAAAVHQLPGSGVQSSAGTPERANTPMTTANGSTGKDQQPSSLGTKATGRPQNDKISSSRQSKGLNAQRTYAPSVRETASGYKSEAIHNSEADFSKDGWSDGENNDEFESMFADTKSKGKSSKMGINNFSSATSNSFGGKSETATGWGDDLGECWNDDVNNENEEEDPWEDMDNASTSSRDTKKSLEFSWSSKQNERDLESTFTSSNKSTPSKTSIKSAAAPKPFLTPTFGNDNRSLTSKSGASMQSTFQSKPLFGSKVPQSVVSSKPKSGDDFLSQIEKESSLGFGSSSKLGVAISKTSKPSQETNQGGAKEGGGTWDQWGAW